MTAYRDDAPSLRAECERLRAENAGLRAAPPRFSPGADGVAERLAATILIGGYHVASLILIVGPRVAPPWAVWLALLLGGVWWAFGIRVAGGRQ